MKTVYILETWDEDNQWQVYAVYGKENSAITDLKNMMEEGETFHKYDKNDQAAGLLAYIQREVDIVSTARIQIRRVH